MSSQASAETISEVVPGIFRVIVPLPIPDVGSMNSYVIMNGGRNLIIDPGMAHPLSCDVMEKAIKELGVDLGRTDFLITHHHLDHFGAVSRFLSGTSCVYISRPEAEFIERVADGRIEKELGAFLETLGFSEMSPTNLISQFYTNGYRLPRPWPFKYVEDGYELDHGRHRFTCLVASGHTIGHSCLYEMNRNFLISGDQITAGVQFVLDRTNPLADHFRGLDRLRSMEVALVLPGHGSPFKDHRKRIDLLRAHHNGRLEAACIALEDEGKDAFEITVAMNIRLVDREPFNALPPILRFIHTRHTFAYLQHLTVEERATKEHRQGRVLFSRRRSQGV
jgi:glyoxylase-like metal-dependent hydrolase (beta-lactamase superfamily II)